MTLNGCRIRFNCNFFTTKTRRRKEKITVIHCHFASSRLLSKLQSTLMKKYSLSFLLFALCLYSFAQSNIEVYPTNWFVGMKNPDLQLMVHHPDIAAGATVSLSYPGVS